ncbi:MAG: flagellar basal body P-ring formation protein FlgA [Verrucomicrobia bacterium]|nr:flagellar basal body P-ring formation protein FlgA [Verrucomicrobiota bacterium]
MTTQWVQNLGALALASLTAWSVQAQSGSPAAASPTQPDTRFLARIVPPVMTNGISVLGNSAQGQADRYTEKDLLFLLSARLQPKPELGELELEIMRLAPPWKPILTSTGAIDVQILDRPVSGLSSQFGLRFEVKSGDKSFGIYFANVKARLYREVWVAPTTVKRGTTLDQAGLVKERRDVINFRDTTFSQDAFELSDLRLAESVNAGAIVLARHVQARPVMFRNDHVQAVIRDDVMSVSTMVMVMSDGAPGQLVKARNLRTKKEVQGKVIDANTIEVLRRGGR